MLACAVVFTASCRIGSVGSPQSYAPERTPSGVMGSVTAGRQQLRGELLEVRDTALVMLTQEGLTLVPYRGVTSIDLAPVLSMRLAAHADFTPARVQRLRMHSRFPYDLPEDVLRELLRMHQQTELRVIR
jgi:hypothetical protein